MTIARHLFALLMASLWGTISLAQTPHACSAAFVGDKMVVDQYTPEGKCTLATSATGELTVQTVELSATSSRAVEPIDFKVAIRDKATGTLRLFADKSFRRVPVQQVLAQCTKGDRIVLLTLDARYALPHNEIFIR
ncbi:hypothetical protein F5984_02480 [Rudanella paleaurantiibacter]|uniref:Uncharacterized protein n=1 Tax=Rudanella paleaurantiibacter TaxID=2614655 RepID=A0A7J5U4Y6_9BACT|nr:hypothetical protein [Rudanella paleaurantiibacter]KAB7732835.1 hypothetical protein F5984_02480 [Rudanella paleaurantiibacter]